MTTITRILCPIDFSTYSRRALDHALALAALTHASVTVLHVHKLTMPVYAAAPVAMPMAAAQPITMTETERERLQAALEEFVARDRAAGARIETRLDEDFDLSGAIVSHARSLPADMIVMGTHGLSGFQRFMLGSVTEKVLRKASCPVLAVPSAPAAGSET